MSAGGRATRAVIDLDAIRHNVAGMRGCLPDTAHLAAVVKANAYGHGAVEVSRAALEAGAGVLAVAMAEEAVPLRKAGINGPILVIGPSNRAQTELGVRLGLDLCVFTPEQLRYLQDAAAEQRRRASMHLKVDTGMGRIGVQNTEELSAVLDVLDRSPRVELAGMFTHFARADEYQDAGSVQRQAHRFLNAAEIVQERGYSPMLHASNSAAARSLPEMDFDMVRLGISMYGYEAGSGTPHRGFALRPAMRIEAEVSAVRDLPAGAAVGYGGSFVTERPSRIATVQIGYGDGYNRLLSNRGRMIVRSGGRAYFAPIVGRVCMDMTMIDVTDISGVAPGDSVVAMGEVDGLRFTADDMADLCGTISYEVLCDYGSRIPRVYEGTALG